MTRKRVFVKNVDLVDGSASLDDQTAHHVESVLRLGPGDLLELRDGSGNAWRGVIVGRGGGGPFRVQVDMRHHPRTESPLNLALALAFSRSDRMDMVLRQSTELGVNRFLTFRAQRSQYGLSGTQAAKRKDRWERIAREALCQCGRVKLPEILVLNDLSELLSSIEPLEEVGAEKSRLRIVAWEEEPEQSLLTLWRSTTSPRELLIAVGPEGGWTLEESMQFKRAGFYSVRLGPRILRLETAALALVSSAQLLWGDLGGESL